MSFSERKNARVIAGLACIASVIVIASSTCATSALAFTVLVAGTITTPANTEIIHQATTAARVTNAEELAQTSTTAQASDGSIAAPHACIDDDNACPRGCSPVNDRDCEILSRVELMERFLKTHQKGNLYTPDPRESLLEPQTEVYRLLYGSQALGYLELFAATGKEPYLREATERLEALLAIKKIWTDSAWDGDLAFAFLRANEFSGNQEFFDTGITAARRIAADYCDSNARSGSCELNWGLSSALCLAEAYHLTGDAYLLNVARTILARTLIFQNADGSFPHQSFAQSRNLPYSSWLAFQLLSYLKLDPGVRTCEVTITYYSRQVTLDVDLMVSRLVSFLKRQVTQEGQISYVSYTKISAFTLCSYCSSPFFSRCKEYCGRLCDRDFRRYPCECIWDPVYDCPEGRVSRDETASGAPDPLCAYCSNPMYTLCDMVCPGTCERDSSEFPCYCVTNPDTQCPRDTIEVQTTYYDESDPTYDTRGWTSELASTAFALALSGEHRGKSAVLDFLSSLQNKDGSFPDKWGYKTELPGTGHFLWASDEHSAIRTSAIFRVLASLLASGREGAPAELLASDPVKKLDLSARISIPSQLPALASVFPNPASNSVILRVTMAQTDAESQLIIVDIAGRTVRTLGRLRSDGSVFSVSWDGTDENGNHVAPGIYFAQMIGKDWRSSKKIVILRD